jgi:hypothetical protein
MRSEIVGNGGERSTVSEAVGGFSVFLAIRISHSICASQVSNFFIISFIFQHISEKRKKKHNFQGVISTLKNTSQQLIFYESLYFGIDYKILCSQGPVR